MRTRLPSPFATGPIHSFEFQRWWVTQGRRRHPGEPITSDAARLDAAIFYLECQAGWRRGQLVENVAKNGGPSQHQVDVKIRLKDHLRRIRERLSAEQSALPPEEADKVIPGYTPEAHAELRSDWAILGA